MSIDDYHFWFLHHYCIKWTYSCIVIKRTIPPLAVENKIPSCECLVRFQLFFLRLSQYVRVNQTHNESKNRDSCIKCHKCPPQKHPLIRPQKKMRKSPLPLTPLYRKRSPTRTQRRLRPTPGEEARGSAGMRRIVGDKQASLRMLRKQQRRDKALVMKMSLCIWPIYSGSRHLQMTSQLSAIADLSSAQFQIYQNAVL